MKKLIISLSITLILFTTFYFLIEEKILTPTNALIRNIIGRYIEKEYVEQLGAMEIGFTRFLGMMGKKIDFTAQKIHSERVGKRTREREILSVLNDYLASDPYCKRIRIVNSRLEIIHSTLKSDLLGSKLNQDLYGEIFSERNQQTSNVIVDPLLENIVYYSGIGGERGDRYRILFYFAQGVLDSVFMEIESLNYRGFLITTDKILMVNFPEIDVSDEENLTSLVSMILENQEGAVRVSLRGYDKIVYYRKVGRAFQDWTIGLTIDTEGLRISKVGAFILVIQALVVLSLIIFVLISVRQRRGPVPRPEPEVRHGPSVQVEQEAGPEEEFQPMVEVSSEPGVRPPSEMGEPVEGEEGVPEIEREEVETEKSQVTAVIGTESVTDEAEAHGEAPEEGILSLSDIEEVMVVEEIGEAEVADEVEEAEELGEPEEAESVSHPSEAELEEVEVADEVEGAEELGEPEEVESVSQPFKAELEEAGVADEFEKAEELGVPEGAESVSHPSEAELAEAEGMEEVQDVEEEKISEPLFTTTQEQEAGEPEERIIEMERPAEYSPSIDEIDKKAGEHGKISFALEDTEEGEERSETKIDEAIEDDLSVLLSPAGIPEDQLPELEKLVQAGFKEAENGSEAEAPPTIPEEIYREKEKVQIDDELSQLITTIESTPLQRAFQDFIQEAGIQRGALLLQDDAGVYLPTVLYGLSKETGLRLMFTGRERFLMNILERGKMLHVVEKPFYSAELRSRFHRSDMEGIDRLFFAPMFVANEMKGIILLCMQSKGQKLGFENMIEKIKMIKKTLSDIIEI